MRKEMIFRILHVVLLVCIVIEGCGSAFGIREAGGWHWLAAVFFVCILTIMNYGRARERLICSMILTVCVVILVIFNGVLQTGDFLVSYAEWLIGKEGWNQEWIRGYELIQTMIITACCYSFQILAEKYAVLCDISAAGLLIGMIAYMVLKREVSHFGVVMALGYIAICYIERTQRNWEKKKKRDRREYVLWILPFCAAYMVLMYLMPFPAKPYDWKFVKDAYRNIKEDITIWQEERKRNGQEDFGTAKAGFSEDGRLMSGFVGNDQKLLTIQGSQGLVTNVYLVGKVYDTFDGKEWEQTITEDTKERVLDTLETLYAIERYDGENKDNYIYSTGLSLRYEFFHTGYVFAPLKLRYLDGCDYQVSGGNLLFGEQKGYGTSYKAVYYQMNLDHPKFYEMAETEMEDDEEAWKSVVNSYTAHGDKHFTMEELKLYQNDMKEKYQKEIVLSPDALDYLDEITEGAETTIQKLRAMEKELSSYTYTKNPGKLPDSISNQEDFLDYFLFESQKGYCSYFATAFVLMARAEGIPARYVEGFCVPVTTNKKMTVTANMAHAWPEVYIEGIGWLPFEPTPGYEEIRYTPWKMKEKKDYGSMIMEDEEEQVFIPTEEIVSETENSTEKDNRFMMMLVSGFFAACFVCLLVLFIEQTLFKRRYLRMSTEEQFLVEVRRNLWLLSRLGVTRKEDETLEEFQERVRISLPQLFQGKNGFVFFQGYEEYLYRKNIVQKEILQATISERDQILSWMKSSRRWHYYTVIVRMKFVR